MNLSIPKIGLATAVAIVLTLLTAYWLRPLEPAAVGLLFVIYLGFSNGAAALSRRPQQKPEEE